MLVRECTLRTDQSALSAIFNSPRSSTSRVSKWLLALHPFRFTVNHIKGEENVAADKVSRIHWPVAIPKAVEIVQLAGEIEFDRAAENRSDSECEADGEEIFQEDSVAQG